MPPFNLKQFVKSAPMQPGVYLMQDRAGEVLYVGKARELRKRLASYSRIDTTEQTKTAVLLRQVAAVETMVTGSEKEALILEASLIKQHRPKYNVILRDDKNYPLLKVTVAEEFPRLVMARQRSKDGARYFGPFSSSSAMWETLKYLNSLFPLRRCKDKVLRLKARPCLNFQMGRCLAPCTGNVSPEQYRELVNSIIMVLDGKNQELIRTLQQKMAEAAGGQRFEEAAVFRDRIAALSQTLEKQRVVAAHAIDQDLFGFVRSGSSVAIAVVFVRKGVIAGQQSFFLAEPIGADPEVLSEVLLNFYSEERYVPKEVLVPFPVDGSTILAELLAERKGQKVVIAHPQRGDKKKLLEIAASNAAQVFSDRAKRRESWDVLAISLQKKLNLAILPERIECLDISNISGQQAVGSLVCFMAGEPAKKFFRHYKIRTVHGPNDYAMMAEVIGRRFGSTDTGQGLPDLFMVDGGKGQLQVAVAVLRELGLEGQVELVGIAKEREGEGEKLYRPGRKNPVILPAHSPVLLYLMRIRDESHRYGVTFHRRLRTKKAFTSDLDAIPGVGKKRREALLVTLGSMKRIREADRDELARVDGIGPELAALIWNHLHPDQGRQ